MAERRKSPTELQRELLDELIKVKQELAEIKVQIANQQEPV